MGRRSVAEEEDPEIPPQDADIPPTATARGTAPNITARGTARGTGQGTARGTAR